MRRSQGALHSEFDHDPAGRLTRQRATYRQRPGDAPVLGRHYQHDAAGRVSAIDDLRQGASRYLYDPADRLLQVQGALPESFVHDPADNLIGNGAQSSGDGAAPGRVEGNRLLMLGDRHYEHDSAGNRVRQRRGSGGRQQTDYDYDADNRLLRVRGPTGSVAFEYDALNRRVAKRVHGAGGELQAHTRFIYDGATLLEETRHNAQGQAQQRRAYVFQPGSFQPLAMLLQAQASDGPVQVLHYHLDHLGTPRELTDEQGRIVWAGRYRAYGALALKDEAWPIDNPIRFQGQYHDQETGLHYNLHRYYDPEAGRFINQDPIGLAGGDNAYRYAPNPVNWVDPLGLTAADCAHGNGASRSADDERYERYWTRHAPEQSAPYSTYRRYTETGDIKQVTTYDQYGNRHRQYDLIDSISTEHQHNFECGPTLSRPKGARSDHLPIDE